MTTRSGNLSGAVFGDKQCELRPTYGLRGVRVGEASHPGPVQTRNARRLQSTLVDSERAMVSTQIDPDDDPPVSSGRFAPLSSDSDSPHVRHAPADAVDGGRIAVRIVPSAPKRLRLTSRSLRMSKASTLPAVEFALTQVDSDLEAAGVEAERNQERGNTLRCEPWVGGTPSSPEDVAPPPALPPPGVFVVEVPVDMQGDTETDSVG